MYLSRILVNPRSRQVRSELANPYELHRTICRAFPDANYNLNEPSGILFRLDLHARSGLPILIVQSHRSPDWSFLLGPEKTYLLPPVDFPPGINANPEVKAFRPDLRPGQNLLFRLRANPTKRLGKNEGADHHKRVGILREVDQLQWLERKLEAAGARLHSARTSNHTMLAAERRHENGRQNLTFLAVQFDGVLTVLEPEKLIAGLESGIGSGKGLGFGLLSLAPLRG
jgi:CRISPR system Cascade subunit CasE